MTLTKQGTFTKKVTDLPNTPSPNVTPADIKSYFQTPSDELAATHNALVDDLTANTAAGLLGAKDGAGATSNVQAQLDSLNTNKATTTSLTSAIDRISTNETDITNLKNNKTDKTGDHLGTWHGFTPSQADPGISSVVDSHTAQLAETTNNVDNIVNPANFATVDDAISYAKTNKKVITAKKITLTKDTSFRGVGLNIGEIVTNGYIVELGGYSVSDVNGQAATNPTQKIGKITPIGVDVSDKLFIRGAIGQIISINQYYGMVNFRLNLTDDVIAYSEFHFTKIQGIDINNDVGVPSDPGKSLWCNENDFYLNRCNKFTMGGSYPHDHNRIHGGTFEGDAQITINKGTHNRFYDLRFEGSNSVTITFADGTTENIIYRNPSYYVNVVDNGYMNSVVYTMADNGLLLNNYSVKINSFNAAYQGAFKNLQLSSDSLGLVGSANQVEILETEYLDNPQNLMFMMKCTRKIGKGLAIKYKLYDINFNEITNNWKSPIQSFYRNPCNNTSIGNKTEGYYVPPGNQEANTDQPVTNGIYNDRMAFYPTSYWSSYKALIDGTHPQVAYVKFFIIRSDYFNPTPSEVYDINAQVYDLSNNFHYHYFL